MSSSPLELPELILLEEFGGDWDAFLDKVYLAFKRDFVFNKPVYRGRRLGLKRHPLYQEKEATFWHITSEGNVESERMPDIRRMERIKWPAFIINHSTNATFKVWENERKGEKRILVWHEEENYILVLADRVDYILLWTAFCITYPNQKRRFLREYNEYHKNAGAAQ